MDEFSEKPLKNFWDDKSRATKPFFDAPSTQYYFRREKYLFEEWFRYIRGKKILKTDLWNEAKNTKILVWACKQGAIACGFDISSGIIEEACSTMKKEKLNATFKYGDVRKIPFEDNQFDFFYSMGTVEHTPQYETSIKELYRILKPGGIGIIGVPNRLRNWTFKVLSKVNMFPYGYEKHFTKKEFRTVLEKCGFEVLEESSILSIPFLLRVLDLFLYKNAKSLCILTEVFLRPFDLVETNIKTIRDNFGYLLAFKVRKSAKS